MGLKLNEIADDDRRERLRLLEQKITDPRSVLNVDSLLDTVEALVHDCNHTTIKRLKNIEAFTNRFDELARDINSLRMKPSDYDFIQTIGRGAFGEIQLVRQKSTKKVNYYD